MYATPTWSRHLRDDGRVEYTISVPTRFGGRLFVVDTFDAVADRTVVATRIRSIRRVLWGRDNPEREVKPAWIGPRSSASQASPSSPEPQALPENAAAAEANPDSKDLPWDVTVAPKGEPTADLNKAGTPSDQDCQTTPPPVPGPAPAPAKIRHMSEDQMTLF